MKRYDKIDIFISLESLLLALLIAAALVFGCTSSSPLQEFEANVQLWMSETSNIEVRNDTQVKFYLYGNDLGVSSDTIWIDFDQAIQRIGGVGLPRPDQKVGVFLEETDQNSVYRFIAWVNPSAVDFQALSNTSSQ